MSMLSSTTMELSSTMPTAKVTPASEMTLMERPIQFMPSAVPKTHTGMDTLMMAEAPAERRKKKSARMASTAPMSRLDCTRSSASLM
jgi:hypothetical protein